MSDYKCPVCGKRVHVECTFKEYPLKAKYKDGDAMDKHGIRYAVFDVYSCLQKWKKEHGLLNTKNKVNEAIDAYIEKIELADLKKEKGALEFELTRINNELAAARNRIAALNTRYAVIKGRHQKVETELLNRS